MDHSTDTTITHVTIQPVKSTKNPFIWIFALIILILLTLVPAITSLIKTNESKTERDFPVESTVSPQVAKKVNKKKF